MNPHCELSDFYRSFRKETKKEYDELKDLRNKCDNHVECNIIDFDLQIHKYQLDIIEQNIRYNFSQCRKAMREG